MSVGEPSEHTGLIWPVVGPCDLPPVWARGWRPLPLPDVPYRTDLANFSCPRVRFYAAPALTAVKLFRAQLTAGAPHPQPGDARDRVTTL